MRNLLNEFKMDSSVRSVSGGKSLSDDWAVCGHHERFNGHFRITMIADGPKNSGRIMYLESVDVTTKPLELIRGMRLGDAYDLAKQIVAAPERLKLPHRQ